MGPRRTIALILTATGLAGCGAAATSGPPAAVIRPQTCQQTATVNGAVCTFPAVRNWRNMR